MTRYLDIDYLYLGAAGRDSLFVCGQGDDSWWSTHYNLVTEEERCTVELDDWLTGMTTVLYDNRSCIAATYS